MRGDEAAIRRENWEETRDPAEITRNMATTSARAASEMFGKDVIIVDMREAVSYTDYFVIASAETERQTRRIADEVIEQMNAEGHRPRSRRLTEGTPWITLDFLDVVVHVFTDEARDYYRLESLWRSAPQERWEG